MRSIGIVLYAVPLLAAPGCSGDAFEATNDEPDAGPLEALLGSEGPRALPDAGSAVADSAGGQSPPDAHVGVDAQADATVADTPCGPVRPTDTRTFTGEVCLGGETFLMGSFAANLGAGFADHTPAHPVAMKRFVLDAHEVTVARYRECVQAGACTDPADDSGHACSSSPAAGSTDTLPVTCMTWTDAVAFCAWDGGRRLPTEAEWEHAARGTAGREYPWGSLFDCDFVVAGGEACGSSGELQPVGSKPLGASPEGVFDLAGNAAEWVADWAGSYPQEPVTDPTGPQTGASRVVRGGYWASLPAHVTGYARATAQPELRGPWGFRCARDAQPSP